MAQVDPDQMRTVLNPFFVTKNEFYDRFIHQALMIPTFQALPALRGFWPGSSQYESAAGVHQLVDMSGCGQHLTDNNDPKHHIGSTIRVPYVDFNGTNEWYSSVDSAHWDIDGTEGATHSTIRGLTIGAWVRFSNAASSSEYILSKRLSASQRAYWIYRTAAGDISFGLSSDGLAGGVVSQASAATVGASSWSFVVGRFDPSTAVDVFLNGVLATNSTAIPASIFNSTADLYMAGIDPGSDLMDGNISMAFICAAYIPDYVLIRLYEISRISFGVS